MLCSSVMNFVGYEYQRERERETMGDWQEVDEEGEEDGSGDD